MKITHKGLVVELTNSGTINKVLKLLFEDSISVVPVSKDAVIKKRRKSASRRVWSKDDKRQLNELIVGGASYNKMSMEMKRSVGAIYNRVYQISGGQPQAYKNKLIEKREEAEAMTPRI